MRCTDDVKPLEVDKTTMELSRIWMSFVGFEEGCERDYIMIDRAESGTRRVKPRPFSLYDLLAFQTARMPRLLYIWNGSANSSTLFKIS